jgi:uncharacterized protein (TIGR03435 family)
MLLRRLNIKTVWTCLALAACSCAFGQAGPTSATAPPNLPAFAVTSVKPNPNAQSWHLTTTQDGWSGKGVTLRWILGEAYHIEHQDKIDVFPQWGDSARWDIEGKVDEADAPAFQKLPYLQKVILLRNLLADRFKLAVHYDSVVKPVYVLTVAKGGPKLKVSTPDELPGDMSKEASLMLRSRPGQFEAVNLSISSFASRMTSWTGRNVVDRTGITGRYDIKLDWSPDTGLSQGGAADSQSQSPLPPSALPGPSIFTAVQEQLGLKLEPDKAPVQVFVIDHVEEPGPN